MNDKCEIIALTSFSDYQTFQFCKSIGMKEVLNKPISYKELLRIVLMYAFNLNLNQYTYLIENDHIF
jgi:hypothetical protein